MRRTFDECAAEALKYKTRAEFRRLSNGHYQSLKNMRRVDEACAHMEHVYRSITDEMIISAAVKYSTRTEFRNADQPLYAAARKRGLIDQAFGHMAVKKRKLSDSEIEAIAAKYTTRSEFDRCDTGAYQKAKKRGILDAICAHMPPGDRSLSDAEILAIARQYKTRMIFKESDRGAYITMLRRGLEQQACAHMEYGFTGYREDLPAILYQFRITTPAGEVLHKVGVTNRPPSKRLLSMGLVKGVRATLVSTISFPQGRDARIREKQLHRQFSRHRYTGTPVMNNGNTEVFTVPLL
jgi:cytochrome c553